MDKGSRVESFADFTDSELLSVNVNSIEREEIYNLVTRLKERLSKYMARKKHEHPEKE